VLWIRVQKLLEFSLRPIDPSWKLWTWSSKDRLSANLKKWIKIHISNNVSIILIWDILSLISIDLWTVFQFNCGFLKCDDLILVFFCLLNVTCGYGCSFFNWTFKTKQLYPIAIECIKCVCKYFIDPICSNVTRKKSVMAVSLFHLSRQETWNRLYNFFLQEIRTAAASHLTKGEHICKQNQKSFYCIRNKTPEERENVQIWGNSGVWEDCNNASSFLSLVHKTQLSIQ